jgi:hypothetical protein
VKAHVDWDDRAARRAVTAGQRESLTRAAGLVLGVANRTVPFQEGTLAQSGFTDIDGDTGVVAYDTPYAVVLHENPQFRFGYGRRGKWLSLALGECAGAVRDMLAKVMREKLP